MSASPRWRRSTATGSPPPASTTLVARAEWLGWPRGAVRVIDDDLGVSGASTAGRSGFAKLAVQVGLGQVGIVLSLECSRLARNNADWGTVQRTVFPARHAGLRSGEMRTVSDDIRRYESTQA